MDAAFGDYAPWFAYCVRRQWVGGYEGVARGGILQEVESVEKSHGFFGIWGLVVCCFSWCSCLLDCWPAPLVLACARRFCFALEFS